MKYGARHELVRGEQIDENASPGTVELFDRANEEVSVELIRAANVNDMNGVNALAIGCAIELHSTITDVLIQMLVRLQREAAAGRSRTALKRADGVIESGPTIVEIAIEIQPPKDLYLRLSAESVVPKPLAHPGFTAPALIDSKEPLTREVQANTDHRESFVAVLNLIPAVLVPREQVHSFQRRPVRVFWIEIQLSVSPTGGKSGAVIEGSVHLKVIPVMLDLCSKCIFPIAEEVVNLLRRGATLGP